MGPPPPRSGGPRQAALLRSDWRPHQNGWGGVTGFLRPVPAHRLCNTQTFATFCKGPAFPLQPPGSPQDAGEQHPAPSSLSSSQQRQGLSLFSAPTLLPFLCPGCVGAGGQDWGGAEGCSARGCEGPGATSRGSGVQGGVGESTRKLPRSRCRGASEPSGLRGLAPLGPAGQAGGLWCLSPALQTDGRAPGCRLPRLLILPPPPRAGRCCHATATATAAAPTGLAGPRAAQRQPAACTGTSARPEGAGRLRRRSRWPWPAPPALCSCPGGRRSCQAGPGAPALPRARARVRARRPGAGAGSRCHSRSAPCA